MTRDFLTNDERPNGGKSRQEVGQGCACRRRHDDCKPCGIHTQLLRERVSQSGTFRWQEVPKGGPREM